MKLEHVAINVSQPAEQAAWWAEHLGMSVVLENDSSPFIHFVADTPKQSMIELYNNPGGPVPDYNDIHPLTLHFAFATDDIHADHKRLLEAGATDAVPHDTTPAGDQLLIVRDPWGTPVQLVQRAKPLV